MKQYGFGVDIGGTTCKLGLFTMDGTLVEKWEIATNLENHGSAILEDVAKAVLGKLEEHHIDKDNVQGIGLGVPGPVGDDGTVYVCVNLGWDEFNCAQTLSDMTGLPVRAGNDANVAALGEMWVGGGKGHKSIIMVTLGTGVGGGIVIDGKVVAGAHGAGGEIGHIKINYDEKEVCGCGKTGCLEQYASATGIVRMTKKHLLESQKESCLRNIEVSSKAIFDAAKDGDVFANEMVDIYCKTLGYALANLASIIDPEVIVLGGGVSKAGDMLTNRVQCYFQERTFSKCESTKVVLATLGNDAGIYGCVRSLF